ncbi:hypothetical protein ACTWJ8_40675 (plasmid) [Streptomyces sp. SDT5-1]|uniref:hypothetical protein n=1 Tax=Streptomyces sp. SDT5-1 TaxID=3406418 RepID=UPI003FD55FF6
MPTSATERHEAPTHQSDPDPLRTAGQALLTAYQQLGAEHAVLVEETRTITAKDRASTVRRMHQDVQDVARQLLHVLTQLATVRGKQNLGLDGQFAKDATGGDYTPLLLVSHISEELVTLATLMQCAVDRLAGAYTPRRRNASLSVVRCPEQMNQVVRALDAATLALTDVLTDVDESLAEEFTDACTGRIAALRAQIPSAAASSEPILTADSVVRVILSDPVVADAARRALQKMAG